jgi:hypothetical protein
LVGILTLKLAESEFAFTEFGAEEAVFGGAFFEFNFLLVQCASLFVSGNLVKFAEFIGGFDAGKEFENSGLKQVIIDTLMGKRRAVQDCNKVCGGKSGLTGEAERAGFETALVVTTKFHQAEQNTVGFEEELLDFRVGEAIQPAVYLRKLVVGELGEFGWE